MITIYYTDAGNTCDYWESGNWDRATVERRIALLRADGFIVQASNF